MIRTPRQLALASAIVLVGGAGLVALPAAAGADGPTTFTNPTSISIPNGSSSDQSGVASPYPSPISVSGLTGQVTAVTATFNGLSHTSAGDIDALLVSPTGENLELMSDLGDPNTFTIASNATITFADGSPSMPQSGSIPTGTYAPTNVNPGDVPDTFPAPAPAPSAQTTLAGAFTGIAPNGTWSLYIADDNTGDVGTMTGGWSLAVTTSVAAASTTTSVSADVNPALLGAPVEFTAAVSSGGSPVTSGTVDFSEGTTVIASDVAVDGSGHASATTSSLTEGTHTVTATYSGTSALLPSNGSANETIDHATSVSGTTYCNTGPITIPQVGEATPYGSHIAVSGLAGAPASVTASLSDLSHTYSADIDILLVGPGGQNIELMSDVGTAATGANLTFADGAPALSAGAPVISGTYAPTNDTQDGSDTFPAPAPAASAATQLSTFAAVPANGTWSLYVVDDAAGDEGSISGGWCVSFAVPTAAPTTTAVTVQSGTIGVGTAARFTATVTSGGDPVTTGSVDFVDVSHPNRGPSTVLATVPVDGTGHAVYTTDSLPAGRHVVQAKYSGTAEYEPSSGATPATVRVRPVAAAGGPYTLVAGNPLTLDASGSTLDASSTVRWDINGDGIYTDATGVNPTVTWSQLQALGITAGVTYHVRVVVTTGGVSTHAGTSLKVTAA